MSGLIGGYFFTQKGFRPISAMRSACTIMGVGDINHESSFEQSGLFSLCTISSNDVHPCGVFENESYHIVFFGSLYNQTELLDEHGTLQGNFVFVSAELVARLYEKYDRELVNYLNGVFVCVIWDKVKKKLLLLSDRYGFEHLYYYRSYDLFLFSSNIFALQAVVNEQLVVDHKAIADLFNFNVILDNRSVSSSFQLCESAMSYEIWNGQVDFCTYWKFPSHEPFIDNVTNLKEESKRQISSAVRRVVNGYENVGCLISGGLDSRLLAAVLNEQGSVGNAFSYSHTVTKNNDHIIAQIIANQLQLPFHLIVPLQEERLESEIRRDLLLTDGQFAFVGLNNIIAVSKEYQGISLVNGFLMDTLFKSGWMFFKGRDNCNKLTEEQLAAKYITLGDYVYDRFLLPDFAVFLKERKRKSIKDALMFENLEKPEETSFSFYCRNRGRRYHYVVSKAFRNFTNFIMPGTDYHLFDFASRLPYALRSNSCFYREIIAEWFPGVAAIPWDKTGRPLMDVDRINTKKYRVYEKKMKYFLQRATHGMIDLQNPRDSFNKRFRQDKRFREEVLEILFDKDSLERGYYDRIRLERLVREQLQGRDYSRLFSLLMRTEMLHRLMVNS